MFYKKCWLLIMVLVLSIPVMSYAQDNAAGDVRVFNALEGLTNGDIYLNDFFAGTVSYGEAVDYMLVPPGEVRVRAFAPGEGPDGEPWSDHTFTVEPGQNINATLISSGDLAVFAPVSIDAAPVAFGEGRINLIHAVGGAAAVDVTATAPDGTVIDFAQGLNVGDNATMVLPAGAYLFNAAGLLTDVPVNLNAGMIFSVFIVGENEVRVFPGTTALDTPAGFVRFVHTIPAAPDVDIYLNGALSVVDIGFGRNTTYMALEAGDYEAVVFEMGADPATATPLGTSSFTVQANDSQVAVIMGEVAAPTLALFADDRSTTADNSGLQVFNAQTAPINVTIDGSTVIEAVEPGQVSTRLDMAEGAHDLGIEVNGSILVSLADVTVSPHTATNLRVLVVTPQNVIVLSSRPLVVE